MSATPYETLTSLCKDISDLSAVSGILTWDEQVMMPTGAAASRGAQKAALAAVIHAKSTSAELGDAIAAAKKVSDLGVYEAANVRDADRSYQKAVRVPAELERNIAQHEVACVQAWVAARKTDDFAAFAPSLEKMLALVKEKAAAVGDGELYDTMIDVFERGMTAERLTQIFGGIAAPLKQLLEKVLEMKDQCAREVHPALRGGEEWDVAKQAELSRDICKVLGFDLHHGRIDVSVHPFTGGAGRSDVRITTRYSQEKPFEGIMGTVHETGHAMYEQGRNAEHDGMPVSDALSMGLHESQSLFWERMVGQNVGFWEAVLPTIHEKMPHTKDVTADDLFFAINQVNRGLIRVDADELTYPFHIILRFELEKKLLNGTLAVADLPQAWNEGVKEHLGIDVPSDSEGCLQDIHWPSGAFGYFPSYSLGAMTAAQLFRYLKTSVMPDIDERIRSGKFEEVRGWLNKEIHQLGSLYPSLDELLEKVTGEPLNPQYFLEYLEGKYSNLYA